MEQSVLFEEQISLNANDLSKHIISINDILLNKIKTKLENKCSRFGFVVPNTLKMLSRSLGKASTGRFVADYLYQIQVQGDVLNPPDGIVIEGEVIRKNKMGIYLNYKDAIRVIIPRDLHIGNVEFDAIQIGDTIRVQIKKSRFQINDETILSVGVYLSMVKTDDVERISEADDADADADADEAGEDDAGEDDAADDAGDAGEAEGAESDEPEEDKLILENEL